MDAGADQGPLAVEVFYAYGFRGRPMLAIRSPFDMGGEARELVGRVIEAQGALRRVIAVSRQISGPINKGEPIGVEIEPATERVQSAAPAE